MFKYTPPWQALCNSMGHDVKRLSFSPSEDSDVLTQVFHSRQLSAPEFSHPSALEAATPPHTSMESTPRRWVIQPLSPKLDPADLRTLLNPATHDPHPPDRSGSSSKSDSNSTTTFGLDSISIARLQPSVIFDSQQKEESGDVVVQAKQVTVSEEGHGTDEEDWQPSSPGSPASSSGSHCGFYSFVDDPTSPEAELNQAWMVSPERKANLATLKEEDAFTLQTYSRGRKPESLFQEDDDDDSRYLADENGARAVEQWEESQLRKEIILSQAPKQNTDFRKQWGVLESLDLSHSPNKLADGFSLCYRPSSAKTQATPTVEMGTIDDNQIDFSSAREQFLKMEQVGVNSPIHCPGSPKLQRKLYLEETRVSSSTSLKQEEITLTGGKLTVDRTDEKVSKRQSSVFDVLDSGLEDLLVDTSVSYGSDSALSNENIVSESRDPRWTSGYDETPIEQEIRIAQEREESLRRSRGITHSDVGGEMVEIKTGRLYQSTPPPVTPVKAKNRVSFLVQLEKENRRKEDLLSQGKALGPYTRGTFQELEDRKRIFEQADGKSETEGDKKMTEDKMLKEGVGSGVGGGSGSSGLTSPCCPHRHPDEMELYLIQKSSSLVASTPCGPTVQDRNETLPIRSPEEELRDDEFVILQKSLVTVVDMVTSETTNGSPASSEGTEGTESVQTRGSWGKVASTSWSSISSSPSSSILTDSALLTSPPGGKPFVPRRFVQLDSSGMQPRRACETPDLIQREIQQDLKREQELQELRELRARLLSLEGSLDSNGRDVTNASQPPSTPGSLVGREESVKNPGLPVEQRSKMVASQHYSPISLMSKFDKTNVSPLSRPPGRLPCLSFTTAQPWASPWPTSPVVSRASPRPTSPRPTSPRPTSPRPTSPRPTSPSPRPTSPRPTSPRPPSPVVSRALAQVGAEVGAAPTQKGLTETLLDDFEERRIKLKREEGSYAGIQPVDDVNNEVLEATRVTRRKSKYALRWEAGLFNTDPAPSTVSS